MLYTIVMDQQDRDESINQSTQTGPSWPGENRMNTFTKLKSGAWGVRISGETGLKVGPTSRKFQVQTKAGTVREVTLERVLWTDGKVALCSIDQSETPRNNVRSSCRPGTRTSRPLNDEDECEVCGKNKWTCGHCVGW